MTANLQDFYWNRMIAAVEAVRERARRATAALERHGIPYAVAGGNAAVCPERQTRRRDLLSRLSLFRPSSGSKLMPVAPAGQPLVETKRPVWRNGRSMKLSRVVKELHPKIKSHESELTRGADRSLGDIFFKPWPVGAKINKAL